MVRILPSGEIVPDDDPRLQNAQNDQRQRVQRRGYVQHDDAAEQQAGMGQGQGYGAGGQYTSPFDALNKKLLDAGLPRWNIGTYVVEPIVSVGFLLALMLIGFHGLIFAGLLFFVVKYSQQGAPGGLFGGAGGNQQGQGPSRGPSRGPSNRGGGGGSTWTSGGNRLGR